MVQKVTIKVEGDKNYPARGTFIVEQRQRDVWSRQTSKDIAVEADGTQVFMLQNNQRLVFDPGMSEEAAVYDRDQAAAVIPSQQRDSVDRADRPRIVPPERRPVGGLMSPPAPPPRPAPPVRSADPTKPPPNPANAAKPLGGAASGAPAASTPSSQPNMAGKFPPDASTTGPQGSGPAGGNESPSGSKDPGMGNK